MDPNLRSVFLPSSTTKTSLRFNRGNKEGKTRKTQEGNSNDTRVSCHCKGERERNKQVTRKEVKGRERERERKKGTRKT